MESTTPKRKTKRTQKRRTFIIEEVYPDGMTREQYINALRQRARYFARLFLQIYPNVLIKDEPDEKVVTSPRF